MSKEYLLELIGRMNIKERYSDSNNSISWHAHREAEKLIDPSLFPLLIEIIEDHPGKKEKDVRRSAYFILGKLLKFSCDPAVCQYYINRLTAETDKYVISSMLELLFWFELPDSLDISPIILCSKSDKWQIRHSALRALGSSATDESRAALRVYLETEDDKQYKYELIWTHQAIGRIGIQDDIPYLEKRLNSRVRDVKESAEIALERILLRTQPPHP